MKRSTCAIVFTILYSAAVSAAGDYRAGHAAFESKDYYNAYKEWVTAAAEGDSRSQYRLSKMFLRGEGLPKRRNVATKLFIAAADQGHKGATTMLAKLAERGDRRAQKWASRNAIMVQSAPADEKEAEQAEKAEETVDSPSFNFLDRLFGQ